jgi:spore coat protein CotF
MAAYKLPPDAVLYRYGPGEGAARNSLPIWVYFPIEDGTMVAYKLAPEQYAQFFDGGNPNVGISERLYGSPEDQPPEFPQAINAGSAEELNSITTDYGSYGQFWNHIVNAYMGSNPAKDDPEVRRVLARVAANPDMGQTELENLLKTTNWYKSRTEAELEWNDLSPTEQQSRIEEQAARLSDMWFQEVGSPIGFNDTQLRHFATQVASGKMGLGQVLQTWVRPEAERNPESPWSRTKRNEQENQRQRGVDIENQTAAVRQLATEWGVQMTDQSLAEWGNRIVSKEASDADFQEYLKGQAEILYAWKDREVKTIDAAQPWLQAYSRVLERGQTDLFNPVVQQALQTGVPLFEFEKQLKQRPEWLETGNAREQLNSMAGDIGQRMGFA